MMRRVVSRVAALCLLLLAASAQCAVPTHDITVRIEPGTRQLDARDILRFDELRPSTVSLSARFKVDALVIDGRRVTVSPVIREGMQRFTLPAARTVEVRWRGVLAELDRGMAHRDTLTDSAPVSAPEGTFLPAGSGWYPAVDGSLERYRLTLDLPATQRGLVAGRLIDERVAAGRYRARFTFPEPAEGITLMAGPYRIDERTARTAIGTPVRLRTYFHPQIVALAPDYLDSLVGYLDLYERWIGPYPFTEFSVVSSPTPTGFGMPTLTYLGVDVLRLPFIRATSLGHEVLHNWWGNGVYPDYARGNWSEGLTTFMADYTYKARDGEAAATAARLAWLRDYAAMPTDRDTPLVDFTSRTHGASQVVGYNKAAMLFYMLRESLGSDAFDDSLRRFWRERRFQLAGWDDLQRAFEAASGRPLGTFFSQWLKRAGAPALTITHAQAIKTEAGWRIAITLAQGAPAYALSVPLQVSTSAGEVVRRVELAQESETVSIDLTEEPLAIALDPAFQLFRRLGPSEAPPILRAALLTGSPTVFALGPDAPEVSAAQEIATRLFQDAGSDRAGMPVTLVAGLHAEIDDWLARSGLPERPANLAASRGTAQVWTLRAGDARTFVLASARDAAALQALARPLPHYGQQSWLVFEGARVVDRGVWPARPQQWAFKTSR